MRSRRLFILVGILISLVVGFPLALVFTLSTLPAFQPRTEPWETIESIDTQGRWKLKTRGVDRRGDILGRGKFYDPGVQSLWRSGHLVLDGIQRCEVNGSRWALALMWGKERSVAGREARVVDLSTGVIERAITFNGTPATYRNSRGDFTAIGVYDEHGCAIRIELIEFANGEVRQHTVFSETDRRAFLKWEPWAPDGSSLAFLTSAWSKTGWENAKLVQLEFSEHPFKTLVQDIPIASLKLYIQWSNGKPELVP